jgi:signal transduction histidine kinase
MMTVTHTPNETELLERLASHQTLRVAPHPELLWLIRHGEFRKYDVADPIARRGMPVTDMVVMLSGRIGVYVERASGRRHVMESVAGEVSGLLPYSRLATATGEVLAEEPTEVLAVHRDHFQEMIRECPVVTATLVHTMIDRAREFASTDWQDDKMVSLGRLAAGIAHELNNPASAAMRSAQLLENAMREAEDAAHLLGRVDLDDMQRARIVAVRDGSLTRTTGVFSALELSDREDVMTEWLDAHGADTALAPALTESDVPISQLDELAECLSADTLPAALRWVAAGFTVRSLAIDIERATRRIHDLVSAVRRFTYMDRATVSEPTDVAQGLMDTVAVLTSKAKARSAAVRLDLPPSLPAVPGRAGELNQVWSNLLENALDAVTTGGEVIVRAGILGDHVAVRVIDDGHGIPPDVQPRVFDPFFTTKPIGEGTGLGLDIARRIVRSHNGQISFDSRPGRTEFCVMLPLADARAAPAG